MLDSALRPMKDRWLMPIARLGVGRVHPIVISSVGLAFGLSAAVAASQRLWALAVGCWLLGRLADGLDGLVARSNGRSSDVGGLIDFGFDTIAYAALPLGVAWGVDERNLWIATAVVLASFYVNAVSLGAVAALLEKRSLGAAAQGQVTTTTLPRGLIEGTETIVVFTVVLAVPGAAVTIWWLTAVAVLITAIERVRWAARLLR